MAGIDQITKLEAAPFLSAILFTGPLHVQSFQVTSMAFRKGYPMKLTPRLEFQKLRCMADSFHIFDIRSEDRLDRLDVIV